MKDERRKEGMKVGIFGGSFNPVHFGHIGLAKWVIANTDIDELWLMVSPNNPLKEASRLAPEAERLAAVRKAVQDIPHVEASDFEFTLPRPSYTANTLRALQQAYPQHEFTLVIGEDNLAIFTRWREYEYILENFRIFVYPRHDDNPSGEAGRAAERSSIESGLLENFVSVKELRILIEAPYFDISSTSIRRSQGLQ